MSTPDFPVLLQAFFTERLMRQRRASPHTIAGYRDTFRLLLRFATRQLGKTPSALTLGDLDAPFIAEFLEHLERDRGNSARTRNVRLSAIRSFFRYVALSEPACSAFCQRVLAMPRKRHTRRPVEFLTRTEINALLEAPPRYTWTGRRDRALLAVAIQTGFRVSELIGLRQQHVVLEAGAHVTCEGKGRKHRAVPLRADAIAVLGSWLAELQPTSADPVFPSARRGPLSRDAVERLVAKHAATAQRHCPSLKRKRVTPHVLRHTAAMELLQSGVDLSVIALWLGHESVETTQIYLHADMTIKERALSKTAPFSVPSERYHPDEQLLAFLESL